jgi:hypothetical protein
MLTSSEMKVIHFSPLEPDVVSSEVWAPEDRLLAELIWARDGSKLLHLSPGEGVDLDATAFLALLAEESAHLDDWSARLREPGGIWTEDSGRSSVKSASDRE